MPTWTLDHQQVMRELYDYKTLLDNVPKVYDHITNGRVSKPNTLASVVTALADDIAQQDRIAFLADDLSAAMQEVWDEWTADTGCVPNEFHIHGPASTRVSADFTKGSFARLVAERIVQHLA